ncbi:MAG: 6-phosphogluconolactonase, partial [Pseudomonadales bacterium]|nr:6-phosphogluconolactonase [Pseudomonadales bacterium]
DLSKRLVDLANDRILHNGRFTVVLAGGETPRTLYRELCSAKTDWSRWHVFFSDERCLPGGHAQRNDEMVKQSLLDHVAVPGGQVHHLPSSFSTEALLSCQQTLDRVGLFDLVLLGLGEDGHTAGLFPGHPLSGEKLTPDLVCVEDAPKPPPRRISLSAERLAQTRALWFLVVGEDKRKALAAFRRGEAIPANALKPKCGIEVFLDRLADS